MNCALSPFCLVWSPSYSLTTRGEPRDFGSGRGFTRGKKQNKVVDVEPRTSESCPLDYLFFSDLCVWLHKGQCFNLLDFLVLCRPALLNVPNVGLKHSIRACASWPKALVCLLAIALLGFSSCPSLSCTRTLVCELWERWHVKIKQGCFSQVKDGGSSNVIS
jgi:hypothetical protein